MVVGIALVTNRRHQKDALLKPNLKKQVSNSAFGIRKLGGTAVLKRPSG